MLLLTKKDSSWLVDPSVTHHVTSNLQNLNIHNPYGSVDAFFIGDGTCIEITHTGSTSFNSSSASFQLNNVLCVPNANKNLLSVSQLCDNNSI